AQILMGQSQDFNDKIGRYWCPPSQPRLPQSPSPPPPSQPQRLLPDLDEELQEILDDPDANDDNDAEGDEHSDGDQRGDPGYEDREDEDDEDEDEDEERDQPGDPATLFDNDSDVDRQDRHDAAALLNESDSGEGDDVAGFKHGPVPNEAKKAMNELHARYMRDVEALAAQHEKPVSVMLALVGMARGAPRYGMNGWNAFEIWYNTLGDTKKPDD
ncbi:hypothetical protein H0H92_013818, partial [Tricholoma furcatifolium]